MEVSIHCPICKAHYDVDESVIGETVTCECGQNFIAHAEDKFSKTIPLGYKQCPNCGEPVETASILCVECGYNFSTGTTVGAAAGTEENENEEAEAESGPGIFAKLGEKLKPLIKPFIITLLVVIAVWGAYLGYSSFTTKPFGISKTAPLGTLSKLEGYFQKIGLQRQGSPSALPKEFGTTGKLHRYYNRQLAQLSKGVLRGIVAVAVDSNGQVCGVTASFTPPGSTIAPGIGDKVRRFIELYWRETGCVKNPQKRKIVVHKGLVKSLTWREAVTNYSNAILSAQWRETLASETSPGEGENDIFIVKKPYHGATIIGGRASGNDDEINREIKKLLESK